VSNELQPEFINSEAAAVLAESIAPGVITLIQQRQLITSMTGSSSNYLCMALDKPLVPLIEASKQRGWDFCFLEPFEARCARSGNPDDRMNYHKWIVINENGHAVFRADTLYERMRLQLRKIYIETALDPAFPE